MPLYIRNPSFSTYWKVELLSAIFPAIAYGIVVVLSGNCFHLLQRKRDLYPNRRRILLLIYVIFMLLNSTWHQIGSIFRLMAILTRLTPNYIQYNLYFFYSFGIPFTVTMWGADGFMIWRCLVLYQDVSKGPRVGIIVILLLISFASFACGVMTLVSQMASPRFVGVHKPLPYAYPAFTLLSALVNIILTTLVIFRLVYHRRYVRNALGVGHGSLYTNIITMCVESSALMVISCGIYTILAFVSVFPVYYGAVFITEIIPHIYVISPLLIVYRVAIGRAIPPTLLPSEQVMAQIRGNIPVSNPSNQEREV